MQAMQVAVVAASLIVGIYLGVTFVTRVLEQDRNRHRRGSLDLADELETLKSLLGVIRQQELQRGKGKKSRKR